jgi:hypothetical protein
MVSTARALEHLCGLLVGVQFQLTGSTMSLVTLVLSQPAAEIPFGVTAAVWVIGERILSFRDLRSGAWKSRQDAGSYFAVTVGIVGGFGAGLALALHQTLVLPSPAFWVIVGLTLAWIGMLLRLSAVLTLGRLFTTTVVVRQEQAVVTGGPYRFVRHPSYLGVLILLAGFGLALGGPGQHRRDDCAPSSGADVADQSGGGSSPQGARRQLHGVLPGPRAAGPLDLVKRPGESEGLPSGVPEFGAALTPFAPRRPDRLHPLYRGTLIMRYTLYKPS